MKKHLLTTITLVITAVMLFNFSGCAEVSAAGNLMEGITAKQVADRDFDNSFTSAYLDFALTLFQGSDDGGENLLISPLSVMLALAMTANGATGNTLSEMETVLGGGMTIASLNEYLHTYVASLSSGKDCKLSVADSIWFRNGFTVKSPFLQTNADYYNAGAFSAPFDKTTVNDINNWVKKNTDGMIDRLLDGEISSDTVMYLINAIAFDAKWQKKFDDTYDGKFTSADGSSQDVTMMTSTERRYIKMDGASGFIKYYTDTRYAFVALLPDSTNGIDSFVSSLTSGSLSSAVSNAKSAVVHTTVPEFTFDYSTELSNLLSAAGMPTAFNYGKSSADFSGISEEYGDELYISRVIHKTHISVDTDGTKAAAVTGVEMNTESAFDPNGDNVYYVKLDRPFVCAIIDTATGMPLFLGTVNTIK